VREYLAVLDDAAFGAASNVAGLRGGGGSRPQPVDSNGGWRRLNLSPSDTLSSLLGKLPPQDDTMTTDYGGGGE
jgi:hypothetical protein